MIITIDRRFVHNLEKHAWNNTVDYQSDKDGSGGI